MAVNDASSTDLAAQGGKPAQELQHKGGEPITATGTSLEPGDQLDTDSEEYAKLLDLTTAAFATSPRARSSRARS